MRRMMHPKHGFHVVSAGDDVELMRRNGWVDDDGRALAQKLAALGLAPAPAERREGDDHIALVKAAITATFPPRRRKAKG